MRLLYNPLTGKPVLKDDKSWFNETFLFRMFHSEAVWLFNPWTGVRRADAEVTVDLYGQRIPSPAVELHWHLKNSMYEFFQGEPSMFSHNQHFENHQITAYLRIGYMYLGGATKERHYTIQLARVTTALKGKGLYTQLLGFIDACAQEFNLAIFVENVLDPVQHAIYIKRGFEVSEVEGISSFYKLNPTMPQYLPCGK